MKIIGASLIIAASLAGAGAQTNAPAVRALSLADCLTEAVRHNFDVRVERYEPEKSKAGLSAAYAGYDPLLNFSTAHEHNRYGGASTNGFASDNFFKSDLGGSLPLFGTTYDFFGSAQDTTSRENTAGSMGVKLTQPLLKNFWIDNTRLLISAAKNNLKLSEQGLRQQLITTVTAVENAYYELIFARENVNVQQQALALAEKQLADDKIRVQYGTMAESGGTIEQDEAQVAQSRANLIAAQFTLASDQNALKNLITDDYSQWHGIAIEPAAKLEATPQSFDLQQSWNQALTQHEPLIRRAA